MTDLDPGKALAAQRSHEDAKAANALFQAAGQAAILINGGASTAILAFSASEKAVIRIAPEALAGALICFAAGVVAGACIIGCQALSAQRYAVRWQNEVLGKREDRISDAKAKGHFWGICSQSSFMVSMMYFFFGAIILSTSLQKAPPPAPAILHAP